MGDGRSQIYIFFAHPRLEKTGLCSHAIDLDAHKEKFTEQHGQLVNDQYVFLSTGTFKALKGPDRENLNKLQGTIKNAGQVIVSAFIHIDLIPYLGQFAASFTEKKAIVEPVLCETSCMCQLQGGVLGSGRTNIMEIFKEFSTFMKELSITADGLFSSESGGIDAAKAQLWIKKWQGQSTSLIKAIQAFEQTPDGSAEPDTVLSATTKLGPTVPALTWLMIHVTHVNYFLLRYIKINLIN